MDVKLGLGDATGMFFHAPAGTELPATLAAALPNTWTHVGDVSDAGLTIAFNKSVTNLKNWANKIARLLPAEESGTVSAPIIDTTEESFKTIFGSDNVTVTAATATHGKLISVDVTPDAMPDPEAFLFLMKDGDDMIMIGTTRGYISELGEVAFQPNAAITWDATISADKWTVMKDNGQKSS